MPLLVTLVETVPTPVSDRPPTTPANVEERFEFLQPSRLMPDMPRSEPVIHLPPSLTQLQPSVEVKSELEPPVNDWPPPAREFLREQPIPKPLPIAPEPVPEPIDMAQYRPHDPAAPIPPRITPNEMPAQMLAEHRPPMVREPAPQQDPIDIAQYRHEPPAPIPPRFAPDEKRAQVLAEHRPPTVRYPVPQPGPAAAPATTQASAPQPPRNLETAPAPRRNAPLQRSAPEPDRAEPMRLTQDTAPVVSAPIALPVPPASDSDSVQEVDLPPEVLRASYLSNPKPIYPEISRRLGEQGTVLLRVLIDVRGEALQIELKTSSGYARLDSAALQAVRGWTFMPARRGEETVSAWVVVPITFSIKRLTDG